MWRWWGSVFFPFRSGLYIAPGKHRVAVRKKKIPLENKYIFSSSFGNLSFILDYAIWIPLISQNFCCNAERVDCFVNKDIWDIHSNLDGVTWQMAEDG